MERIERITLDININLNHLGDQQEFIIDFIADHLGLSGLFYFNAFETYLKRYNLENIILDEYVDYYQSVCKVRVDNFETYRDILYVINRFVKVVERKYDVKGFLQFYNKIIAKSETLKLCRKEFERKAFKMYYKRFIKINH